VLQAAARTTLEVVVRFDYDMATITTETDQVLRAKLPILRNTPSITLRLEGHADERGSIEYNLALGSRRAESVRSFLTGLGISEDRLTTTSFGKERPLDNRSDEAAWAQNRRVEFVITGIPAPIVAVEDAPVEGVPDAAVEDVPDPAEDVTAAVEDNVDDPPDPELAQPALAIVGDVTVESPPELQALPRPVRPTGNSERDRRSRFYRGSLTASTVRASEVADFLWVSRTSTRAAEWLGPMTVEEVEFAGKIESLVVEGDIRTAFPYTWVRLDLEPGFRPRLGDDLQIFRPARVN
jgi:peptidoglycan-associated lipoprotein